MDRLEALGTQLSQITLYDIKSAYNQAKNMVLNVSEMEAKVREATNDEAWGASSTLMQEIAQGTFNFQHFNEIMPCIYARFMEKEARQWREIYKALQLLEYLIKHGSERVVDDARSHLSTIKMLRNFHYIDDKGKDQGINVRNRSRELSELLVDVEKIRAERRKAKANRNKYVGTGNDAMSFSGDRYGGFGNDTLGGGSYSGRYERDYGDSSGGGFRDEVANKKTFEEYDAGEYETTPRRSNSMQTGASSSSRSGAGSAQRSGHATAAPVKEAPKEPSKEVDLLGFLDDDTSGGSIVSGPEKALPAVASHNVLDGGDDDFDDFQTAPPAAPVNKPNAFDLFSSQPNVPGFSQPQINQPQMKPQVPVQQPASFNASAFAPLSPTANRQSFTGPAAMYGGSPVLAPSSPAARPSPSSNAFGKSPVSSPGHAKTPSSVNFDDLWSMSLGSTAPANKSPAIGGAKSIKDLEKEKAMAGIWGSSASAPKRASGMGMGSFGTSTGGGSGASGGDDLLL